MNGVTIEDCPPINLKDCSSCGSSCRRSGSRTSRLNEERFSNPGSRTSLEVSTSALIQQCDLQHDCCFVSTGDHQQHHHPQHDVHQDVAEVRSVGRQQGQHRVRTGLLFGAAAGQGERKHPCSITGSQEGSENIYECGCVGFEHQREKMKQSDGFKRISDC